jgi:hypothetical protein
VLKASAYHAYNYTTIRNIIKTGLENLPLESEQTVRSIPAHENIRGPLAYQ